MICHNCGSEGRHIAWCDQYRPEIIYSNTTPRARNTDPETSHAAAASVTFETLTWMQALVLQTLHTHGPMTDEQLCVRIADDQEEPVSVSGVRTRRSELAAAGMVVDTGKRMPTRTGRQAIVWSLA